MKQAAGKIAMLAVLALLLIPVLEAADQPKNRPSQAGFVTIWQARRTIRAAEYQPVRDSGRWGTIDRNSFRFTAESLEFDTFGSKSGTQHFKLDLKTLEPMSATCKDHGVRIACSLYNDARKSLPGDSPLVLIWKQGPWAEKSCQPPPSCLAAHMRVVGPLIAALGSLRRFANDTAAPPRTFKERAAAWRALPTKTPVPEEVRVQRLLAENAVKEMKPEEALFHYETGLELYPTWPQGYFNAALIAAELGFYGSAVEHMQSYLELVPDAPDAQSARDQIVIWRDKAGQPALKYYYGVGMRIEARNNRIVVNAPVAGSPANKAGILPGDVVAAIDGRPTDNMTVSEVVDLVRGPKGTTVRVTILRRGSTQGLDFNLVRAEIPQ